MNFKVHVKQLDATYLGTNIRVDVVPSPLVRIAVSDDRSKVKIKLGS